VVYRRFGGPEVLEIERRPVPVPGAGEVLVRVAVAGVNPVDWKIFSGEPLHDAYERSLPSGTGYDFAGTIVARGPGVSGEWRSGDRVFGGLRFHAQADHLLIEPQQVARVPDGLSLTVAGALNVAGRTAVASVRSQRITAGETVLVSGAAGGVGMLTAQLARLAGARVLGTASAPNHQLLRELGIEPIAHGSGLIERVRSAAPEGISVVLDTVGHGTVDAALRIGVRADRINTIADYGAIAAHDVRGVGGAAAGTAELSALAALIVRGDVRVPIDSRYTLDRVRDAYARSITGRAVGKIVVVTDEGCADLDI